MSAENLQEKFSGERIAVKICGITNAEDARAVEELGADFIGINFWPESRRYAGEAAEHPWIREIGVCRVGVFVDAPSDAILELWEDGWIDAAQLHGDESPEYCRALMGAGVPVIKALGIKDGESIASIPGFGARVVLLDAYAPAERGGTGRKLNWDLARGAVDEHAGLDIILAGGLDPANVGEAIEAVRPAGVDVASGVEQEGNPRRKDLLKVRRFIETARGA